MKVRNDGPGLVRSGLSSRSRTAHSDSKGRVSKVVRATYNLSSTSRSCPQPTQVMSPHWIVRSGYLRFDD